MMTHLTLSNPWVGERMASSAPWEMFTTYLLSFLTGLYFLLKVLEVLGYPVWTWIRRFIEIVRMRLDGSRFVESVKAFVKGHGAPPGLQNSKVFCYQNSIIQGFAAVPSVTDWLQKFTDSLGASTGEDSVSYALNDIIKKLNDTEKYGKTFNLKKQLKEVGGFNLEEQQDCHEYFLKVLENVEDEAKKALKKKRLEVLSWSTAAKDFLEKPTSKPEQFPTLFTTFPPNPFNGLTAKRVACVHCGYYGALQHEELHALTLNLGSDKFYDIFELLDEFTKTETMSDVNCPKCTLETTKTKIESLLAQDISDKARVKVSTRLKTIETALKAGKMDDDTLIKTCGIQEKFFQKREKTLQTAISRPPKALAIHLQRIVFNEFTERQYKNNAPVDYPENLDIAPWTLNSNIGTDPSSSLTSLESPELNYKLRAVVCHSGSHNSGHYTCFRKRPIWVKAEDKKSHRVDTWFAYSDSRVTPTNERQVLNNKTATLLIYERVPSPPCPPSPPTRTVDDCLTDARPRTKRGQKEEEESASTVAGMHPPHPNFGDFRPLPSLVSAS